LDRKLSKFYWAGRNR